MTQDITIKPANQHLAEERPEVARNLDVLNEVIHHLNFKRWWRAWEVADRLDNAYLPTWNALVQGMYDSGFDYWEATKAQMNEGNKKLKA